MTMSNNHHTLIANPVPIPIPIPIPISIPIPNPAIQSHSHSHSQNQIQNQNQNQSQNQNQIIDPSPQPSDPLLIGSQNNDLTRPPSLIQLTQAMRLNPDRWQQLKQETDAARQASLLSSTLQNQIQIQNQIQSQVQSPLPTNINNPPSFPSSLPPPNNNTGRLRLPILSLQRSDSARAAAAASPKQSTPSQQPLATYRLPSIGAAPSTDPDLPISDDASANQHQLLLQRRASASDINIGFNRARAPSLAAIQERIARLKPDMASASPLPATPDAPAAAAPLAAAAAPPAVALAPPSASAPVPVAPAAAAPPPPPVAAPAQAPVLEPEPEPPTTAPSTPILVLSSAPHLPTASPNKTQPPSPALHPLQHSWTLFFDSRTKRPSSTATATATTGGQAYEAGLQTIGTFSSVEQFCRFFNWTVRPSMMEMHSSVQIFKAGIKPMWEDPANSKGGKWTLTMKSNTSLSALDRLWTYLVLALVGEQVDVHDDVCGAIVATRPRGNRVQVWVREKENVERVNGLGRRLMKVLELNEDSGISVDFTPHSGAFQGASKFISIQANPSSGTPVRGPPSLSSTPLRPTLEGLGALGRVGGDDKGATLMRRSSSMDVAQAAGRPALMMHHSHVGAGFGSPPPSAFVGGLPRGPMRASQLSSHDVPIQNGVWRPSTGPTGGVLPQVGGAPMMASFGSANGRRPVSMFGHQGMIGQFQGGQPGPLVADGKPGSHMSMSGMMGGGPERPIQMESFNGMKMVNGGNGASGQAQLGSGVMQKGGVGGVGVGVGGVGVGGGGVSGNNSQATATGQVGILSSGS